MYPIIYEFIPITFQIILPITVVIWGQYKYNKTYEGFEEKRKEDDERRKKNMEKLDAVWKKDREKIDAIWKKDHEKWDKRIFEQFNSLKLK